MNRTFLAVTVASLPPEGVLLQHFVFTGRTVMHILILGALYARIAHVKSLCASEFYVKGDIFLMTKQLIRRVSALFLSAALLLSSCTPSQGDADSLNDGLTWVTWNGCDNFINLLKEKYPEIEIDFISYAGGNSTGYSWEQMKADDIPDIFITTQIVDKELAKERLADLSGYEFINEMPTSVLDQVAIDGGVYLLPVSYSMYGIFYNKTLMEEKGWEVPENFAELEALCGEIEEEGLIPGVAGTLLTGNAFSAVFNLAKTDWLTTPEGLVWEQDFLAGNAAAEGYWEDTMDYVQRYMDIGMFHTDPEDRNNPQLILDYLGNRKAVFCTMVATVNITELPDTGDKLGMMPYISEDGSKNIYMYSPSFYFGISNRLTLPGNEKKLEEAVQILSLLYSPEGQAAFVSEDTPCVMSVLNSAKVPEDSMISDAQQAFWEGRAFQMTYARWENVLSDMGQAYTDWFRGENGMDGAECIARMDELQQSSLNRSDQHYFCESTENFTLEETGRLIGKVLGSAVGADAVLIPLGQYHGPGVGLRNGITGKLYKGKINLETMTTILPTYDGKYAVMTMTGAQVKELARLGFDADGDGNPYPYLLLTGGDADLEDETAYRVAFLSGGYTDETGNAYSVQIMEGSLKSYLQKWMEEQGTISPASNPWE